MAIGAAWISRNLAAAAGLAWAVVMMQREHVAGAGVDELAKAGRAVPGPPGSGAWSGLVGIMIFSGSLPATRVAVLSFDPFFLTSARAALAGLLGAVLLVALPAARPNRGDIVSLIIVAAGVVIGFPLFTALALRHINSADAIVFLGLLPLATTSFGILRGRERPKPLFWLFALMGSAVVALGIGINVSSVVSQGALFMLIAIVLCGLGYAEGAILTRRLGGWQVISWALILSWPFTTTLSIAMRPGDFVHVTTSGWIAFLYVSIFSMLLGFVFWYRGLALGGIARTSQLQLLQPFFAFGLAGVLLGEHVTAEMIAIAVAVMICVAGARRFG